jgi:transcriptional repressor NrdR
MLIVKKDGSRESYDRNKVLSGVLKSCEKLPISKDEIDKVVATIERKLQATCETEVSSKYVGDLVSKELKKLDKVAYIRFASVYKSFEDLESFEEELKGLIKKPKKKGAKK